MPYENFPKPEDLSLSGMTMFDFSDEAFARHAARMAVEEAEFKARYGDKWEDKLFEYRHGYPRDCDVMLKDYNTVAYHSGLYYGSGLYWQKQEQRVAFDKRIRELYGDQYDELTTHRVDNDPRIAELLITEALRTQRWQELPDELVSEYLARGGVKA